MSQNNWPEYVNKHWKKWSEENPPIKTIDEAELKKVLIEDLTYASQMDVKEYTLYQKWCEIQEKYPTHSDVFGDFTLDDPKQDQLIREVKSNIWVPESPDDFDKLKPTMIYTDDSEEIERVSMFDGTTVKQKTKRSDLPERWNTVRTFISTMKNNANIGRNLNFIVADEVTGKYLGVICISSDFLDLTPRDKVIGWEREKKTQGGMINHTAIGSSIVPLQPLGYNYMGGKLLALLCLSDTVQKLWKEKYGDVLVGVTTTSLYGNTKSGGLSQYDGLEYWNKMGFSSGSVAFEPRKSTLNMIWQWLKENHPEKYFEWWEAKKENGLPFKRDHKNRSLHFAYPKLGIPKNLTRTEHQRGIYFSPLYNNTYDFLCNKISEDQLVKSFDTSEEALSNIWKTKYAKGRIRQLQKKNSVSYETLFYDDLIYMTWEETKQKYLPQVGR
ncbi:MAG: Pelagibacter phage [Candidatus Parcubacteria bacterium]|jgi:hypothetical protein